MAITGNGSLSLRKKDLKESNSIAVGFKRLVFAHKATAGQTGINLASLTTPTEMSSQGFVNATLNDITTSNLLFFRNNLTLMSSAKGRLVDYLSYSVSSGTQINFNGFTADEGEIFVGIIDNDAKTGLNIVDARPISATGTLTVGTTDFNVGTPFEVGKYITSQVGAVIVFRNGQVQFRNAANSASSTDGNYYEVDPGGGLGTVIRFNVAPTNQDDNILVVSNGLVAERPTGSMMATIENINGQLNNMAGYVADAVGSTSATVLGAAPSNVDLKAFGDTVYSQGNRITALETFVVPKARVKTSSARTVNNTGPTVVFETVDELSGISYNNATGIFTCSRAGYYRFHCQLRLTSTAVTAGNEITIVLNVNGGTVAFLGDFRAQGSNTQPWVVNGYTEYRLAVGDTVAFGGYSDVASTLQVSLPTFSYATVSWIGL